MQITQIQWITKTKARIYLDDEPVFILTAADIRALGLKEDMVLGGDTYNHIYQEILLPRIRKKALDLLKNKDYSEAELRGKLQRDFGSAALADSAVGYVRSYRYIDDRRYAGNYIRCHCQNESLAMIKYKLHTKGIDHELICEAIDEYLDACGEEASDSEQSKIRALVSRKFGSIRYGDREKYTKIFSFLLRKGYASHDIRKVLSEAGEDTEKDIYSEIKDFDANE